VDVTQLLDLAEQIYAEADSQLCGLVRAAEELLDVAESASEVLRSDASAANRQLACRLDQANEGLACWI
jgi:hypothetical protein